MTVLAVALAGCGVPDAGGPVAEGAPEQIAGNDKGKPEVTPPVPQEAVDSRQAAELYFEAASSEWAALPEQVGKFVTPSALEQLPRPAVRVTVVRDLEFSAPDVRSPDEHRIEVHGEVIGELAENGVLHPQRRAFAHTFTFRRYEYARESVWRASEPPPGYVLSVEALRERFEALPLYFGNHRRTRELVPDVRYLPKSIEWSKQRTLLVEWLIQGPALWLRGAADHGFPDGVKRRGNVFVQPDGRVVVNLSSEAEGYDKDHLDLMFAQLSWTLRARARAGLEVRIENRPIRYRGSVTQHRDEFFEYNAVEALPEAVGYMVTSGGRVVTVRANNGKFPALPKVLTSRPAGVDHNTDVESVAVTRSERKVALVRAPEGGRDELWIGRRSGEKVSYRRAAGLPANDQLSEPVWVGAADPRSVLVAAGGELYEVDARSARARRLELPHELGAVTSVAIAPDGYRLALVADGRLHVAAVERDQGLGVGDPYLVTMQVSDTVDVAWSREDRVVAVGVGRSGEGLWEVRIDGVLAEPVDIPDTGALTRVAGRPDVVMEVGRRGTVLIEQGDRLYEIFSADFGAPGNTGTSPQGGNPALQA